ncbi:MAG: hypothetical protein SF052_24620 [Bacteroidia bacterium]|nr:hypothetical protein [Bacteroidia bacterium]
MKTFLFGSVLFIQSLFLGFSQCDTTYITTHPNAPFNPENPAKLNTFFDWRDMEYDLNFTVNGQTISTTIPSPFYQIDNNNVSYLYLSEDDKPEDGWELIGRNLGYYDNGTPRSDLTNPYLILYNKYTGLLRIFLAVGKREDDYDAMEIGIKFSENGNAKRTALLDYASLPLNSVQEFDTTLETFVTTTKFLHEEKKWMVESFKWRMILVLARILLGCSSKET